MKFEPVGLYKVTTLVAKQEPLAMANAAASVLLVRIFAAYHQRHS
jgi:hypothetical protein